MNPEEARAIRGKKRLEDALGSEIDDGNEGKNTKTILRELERQYKNEEKEIGKDDYDRMEYFGYRIEPFNMKNDRETGKIHEDGYVELSKTKEKELRDPWLESLEEVEDPRFKAKRIMTNPIEDNVEPLSDKEIFHLRKELYDMLKSGESANQALKRLRPAQVKPQPRHKKNVRKNVKTETNSEQHNVAGTNGTTKNGDNKEGNEEKIDQKGEQNDTDKVFSRIVEICELLCGNGYLEVFSDTKEDIQRKFMKEEDELIKHDLEEYEGKIEDMNPDHNVVES